MSNLNLVITANAAATSILAALGGNVKLATYGKTRDICLTARKETKDSKYGYGVKMAVVDGIGTITTPLAFYMENVDKPNGVVKLENIRTGSFFVKKKSAGEDTFILTGVPAVAKEGKISLGMEGWKVDVAIVDLDAVQEEVVETAPEAPAEEEIAAEVEAQGAVLEQVAGEFLIEEPVAEAPAEEPAQEQAVSEDVAE